MKSFFIALPMVLNLLCPSLLSAKDFKINGENYSLVKLHEGSDVIWGMDFLNPETLIFSQRDGKLFALDLKTNKAQALANVPKVFNDGQGGLLDVFIHPTNKDLYLTYSEPENKGATTSLYKAKVNLADRKIEGERIFKAKAYHTGGIHFGSRLALSNDGHLFMTVGERNQREKAQDLSVHNGKVLRLTLDGKAASGNPFEKTPNALAEIWSYGHRNPQGLIFNQAGELIEVEFGPRGGDEINLVEKGKNYGWPLATYGKEYWGPSIGKKTVPNTEQPLHYWVPSISPSGVMQYSGELFPKLKGQYFLANLAGSHIRRVVIANKKVTEEEEFLNDLEDRFRQIKQSPSGEIFIGTDSGIIYKITKK